MTKRPGWRMQSVTCAVALLGQLALPGSFAAAELPWRGPPPVARANDNRTAAGRLSGGALIVSLDLTEALWRPEGATGRAVPIFAFAESGKAPSIPGPLIRVVEGTEVRATLHNRLDRAAVIHGFHDHDGTADSVFLAAGESRTVTFLAETPGTQFYWARTTSGGRVIGRHEDSQLVGGFIVDPRGGMRPAGERIMVITAFDDTIPAPGFTADHFQVFALNGLSWPSTERLQLTQGDTVHWRVINASDHFHPMHLHGFFFTVTSHGSPLSDTIYAAGDRRQAVTDPLRPGSGIALSWVADRPGNWLFHCHLIAHIDPALRPDPSAGAMPAGHGAIRSHLDNAMAGLVVAVTIRERGHASRTAPDETASDRGLRLFITQRGDSAGAPAAMSYVLQVGAEAPVSDSTLRPGTTLVLHQNEPTEIVVINLMHHTTAVHWHGVELESYYDGIGGWSGGPRRRAPMIAPGDSFLVRITPPRAGTYIYHSHAEEMTQLKRGLFGAFIVLPAGVAERDTTERLLILSDAGPEPSAPSTGANGATLSYTLSAGVTHRLRMVSIPSVSILKVRLLRDSTIQTWRPVAKDGADLPESQAVEMSAEAVFGAGETMDVEIRRTQAERLILEVTRVAPNPVVFRIPVTVQ